MSALIPHQADMPPAFQDIKWPILPVLGEKTALNRCPTNASSAPDSVEGNSAVSMGYETFSFMGEGVLFHHVTQLIFRLYPQLSRESASNIRKQVLSTPHLSIIAKHYSTPSKFKPDGSSMISDMSPNEHTSSNECAESFEAYIGALSHHARSLTSDSAKNSGQPITFGGEGKKIESIPAQAKDGRSEAVPEHQEASAAPLKKRARQDEDPLQAQLDTKEMDNSKQCELKAAELDTFLDALFHQVIVKIYQKSEAASKPLPITTNLIKKKRTQSSRSFSKSIDLLPSHRAPKPSFTCTSLTRGSPSLPTHQRGSGPMAGGERLGAAVSKEWCGRCGATWLYRSWDSSRRKVLQELRRLD
ncbi:hypothetical protein IAT40_000453 [Kwoniella sp. CBS 6097]